MKLQAAPGNEGPNPLEARLDVTPFPSGND
jgi:hypothetical protein